VEPLTVRRNFHAEPELPDAPIVGEFLDYSLATVVLSSE
jgi:hypothetical protein